MLTPTAAWLKAAANVGKNVSAGDLGKLTTTDGWSRFSVKGFAQQQMSRLRAVALANGSVRPVFETNVIDVGGGTTSAYTVLVDAVTGAVVRRQNMVDSASDVYQFQGSVTATTCGPKHSFQNKDAKTTRIVATAAEVNTPQRHRGQDLLPERRTADLERHRHQPGGRHLRGRLDPGRRLLHAGLPVQRPHGPVHRPGQLRRRRLPQRGQHPGHRPARQAEVALLHRQPDAGLVALDHARATR